MLRAVLFLLSLVLCLSPTVLRGQFSSGQDGFWPKLGGFPPGSGFGLGVEFRKSRLANGQVDFRAEANASIRQYEKGIIGLELPRLWRERLYLEFGLQYRNYPQEDYWGIGPDSSEGRRSNFRLEDALFTAGFGFRPYRGVRTGVRFGRLDVNTGPGEDNRFLSIEELFTPENTPGLDRQPDYFQLGAFLEYDSRDRPLDPRSGGRYELRWDYFDDRDFDRFTFRRYELELQQFVPVFEKRDTVAFRALTSLTDTSPGQQAPFFMQRTVGGADDLRGFHHYRFRDKNLLLFNIEYRLGVTEFLDLAAFGDAGRVFSNRDEFGLNDMEGSFGIGGRLKFRERVLIRLDVGVGREGVRIWIRGNHTF